MFRGGPILVLLLLTFFFALIKAQNSSSHSLCSKTCGSNGQNFPYPFGFSDGCGIKLNCSTTGKASVGEFHVQMVTAESISVKIERKCNRPLKTVAQLFGLNYAPTNRNAILLENCTEAGPGCEIPSILVQTHFSSLSCSSGNSSTISCYSEGNRSDFIDLKRLMDKEKKCDYLLSSISVESLNTSEGPVSLAVEVVELGWWLEGQCQCDVNANCTPVSPNGKPNRYRCICKEGFEGDGYKAGFGCRKVFPKCSPARYISGKCRGATRIVMFVGVAAVAASLAISIGLMICCFCRRRSKWKARHLTKRRLSEATGNLNIPIYSFKDMEKATNGFSDRYRLGTGAYGTVYAGKLHSDDWVAIKRIRYRDADSIEQVVNEIKLISYISHPNLVRLLGCSIDYGEQILVYEFMPNGTLCQHLQKERGDGLSWLIRLTIATETAQAIAYLHSAIKPPIYHRDIKSSNILLDHNFRSKVADFGLSRLGIVETSHISTAPQGTPGYLDPQYHQNFHLSDKSDVYSFGVVLVEIITGLKAVDFSRPQNEVNLAGLATDRIGNGRLDEIIDPLIEPQKDTWTLSSVHKVAELAFRCLAFHRDMRPSMTEVAAELDQIRRSRSGGASASASEENTCTPSSGVCSSSSSSNASERPLNFNKAVLERRELLMVQIGAGDSFYSKQVLKDNSPISVQDAWLSEQSSPSSNSITLRNSSRLSA